mmetsp:Transcript_40942/g.97613  ORF Transcript_40942/g.97613 Transcript_40942/m.97613 type:complete len:291 (-) Transcript_40942:688-1560(-)
MTSSSKRDTSDFDAIRQRRSRRNGLIGFWDNDTAVNRHLHDAEDGVVLLDFESSSSLDFTSCEDGLCNVVFEVHVWWVDHFICMGVHVALMQLIAELHLRQPLAVSDSSEAGYQDTHWIAVVRGQNLAVHGLCKDDITKRINGLFQGNGYSKVGASLIHVMARQSQILCRQRLRSQGNGIHIYTTGTKHITNFHTSPNSVAAPKVVVDFVPRKLHLLPIVPIVRAMQVTRILCSSTTNHGAFYSDLRQLPQILQLEHPALRAGCVDFELVVLLDMIPSWNWEVISHIETA